MPERAVLRRRSRIVRGIWAICLSLAGLNHARILLRHGLTWDYGGVGWGSAVYWSSLTLADPLAAVLLFVRPRIGIPLSVILIVTNVAHNLATTARYTPDGAFLARTISSPTIISQVGFMIFVLMTAGIAWRGVPPIPTRQSKAFGER